MKKKLILAFSLIIIGQISAQNKYRYSSEQVIEDLDYMYSTLQKTHYNLFVNTPETEYKKAFIELRKSIKDSMDLLDVYRHFQPFLALSKLGHCAMDYPFDRLYGKYIKSGGRVFPLNIQIDKNKAYIIGNYSGKDSILKGNELLSINEIPIQEIFSDIYIYLSGESVYLKNSLLDLISFPRMMWILRNTQNSYLIVIKDNEGNKKTFSINSIFASDFEAEFRKEKQLFQADRTFKFIEDIAYIKPGPFMNAEGKGNTSNVETFKNDEFVQFIDSAFAAISAGKYNKLIIDLRNNSGGSNTFSDEMLAYIADKPFRFCSKFEVKTSQITKKYWKQVNDSSLSKLKEQILSHNDGEIFFSEIPFHEPKTDSLRFKGKVYTLINRYSYSQATFTAAMIQDFGFGLLIGETTADVSTNYGSNHQFELPNTKIAISYPKAFIVRPNGNMKFTGTEPDIKVERNILSDKDEILDFAIDYIKKDKK